MAMNRPLDACWPDKLMDGLSLIEVRHFDSTDSMGGQSGQSGRMEDTALYSGVPVLVMRKEDTIREGNVTHQNTRFTLRTVLA